MSHGLKLLERYYDVKPSGLIHVGAHNGQEVEDYKASGSRPVVLVEAQDGPYAKLVSAVDEEPGFYPVQACCSSTSGRHVDFNIASGTGQASSYLEPGTHLQYYPATTFDRSVPMVTSTLDDVISNLGLAEDQFEYLALDVQGAEMDVFLGAEKTLSRAKYIWTEVNFGGLYVGDTGLYPLTEYLRNQGFDLYYVLMTRKQWGDALFIRTGIVQS